MDIIQHMIQQMSNKRGNKDKAKVAILETMVRLLETAGKLEQKAKDPAALSEFLEKCLTAKTKPRAFQNLDTVSKQIQETQEMVGSVRQPKSTLVSPKPKPEKEIPRSQLQQPQTSQQGIHIHVNVPAFQNGGSATVREIQSQPRRKKGTIPKSIKEKVWYTYMGKQKTEGLCPCCLSETIKIMHFHTGHVVSEANGGSATVENLRPICGRCNLQMGSMNMPEYMQMYYNRYLV